MRWNVWGTHQLAGARILLGQEGRVVLKTLSTPGLSKEHLVPWWGVRVESRGPWGLSKWQAGLPLPIPQGGSFSHLLRPL